MQPVLLDTSIYISALRLRKPATIAVSSIAPESPVWLSSVVLEELYAGAGDLERRTVERLERDFDKLDRIVVPNLRDWTQTGQVLARLAIRYGYERIGQGRLTNDALIAISAGRLGIRVLTANERDYRRISEFKPFQWQLMKF